MYSKLTLRVAAAWTDRLHGGRADDDIPDDFDPDALAKGVAVESEHTDDVGIATEIAMDHLDEFPNYYNALKKMENKLKLEQGLEAVLAYLREN